jgi:hypothetical protein
MPRSVVTKRLPPIQAKCRGIGAILQAGAFRIKVFSGYSSAAAVMYPLASDAAIGYLSSSCVDATPSRRAAVKVAFDLDEDSVPLFEEPRYNIAPTQAVPIVRQSPAGKRQCVFARWGLIPSWAADPKVVSLTDAEPALCPRV